VYSLPQLLTLMLMAGLAGADDYDAVADWVGHRLDWLRELLGLPDDRRPHASTFERVFRRLEPEPLQRHLIALTQRLADASDGRLIPIDGKTLRRCFDTSPGSPRHEHPLHLVHAWDKANGLLLGQVAVDQKSNEITAVPALLELLDLDGAIVSMDAMHCQKDTAQAVRDTGADYLLAVKDNQKSLREDIELFFDDAIEQADSQLLTHTAEPDNSHGRLDERTVWATEQIGWLRQRHPDWIDLKGIVCVEGKRLNFATGEQSVQRRYYLTSLDPWRVGAQRLGELVRGHWSVENHLHWCLDVSFGDDHSRVRKDHGPENLALVKRLILGLLKQVDPPARTPAAARRTSIPRRRMAAIVNDNYLLQCATAGLPS
jgi:predicted transposase YbfD/YdcC